MTRRSSSTGRPRARRAAIIGLAALLGVGALATATYGYARGPLCSGYPAETLVTGAAELPPADTARARAGADFAARLLALVAERDAGKNIFLSPASAQLALSMVYNGAAGDTRRAMAEALGIGDMSLDAFNRQNQALLARLGAKGPVTVEVANSLWAKAGVPFTPAFLERTRTVYGAEVASLDLGSPAAMKRINRWVSDRTHRRIPTILDRPSSGVLVLLNAVYFKGAWATPFEKRATSDGPFRLARGQTVQRPMMRDRGRYGYARGDGFQALRIAYTGGNQSMYVLLPDSGVAVSALHKELAGAASERWRRMTYEEVILALPRFRLEYEADLMASLEGLGMGVALDPNRADFGGMAPAAYLARGRLYISGAKQRTFVAVNEEGTEAAAVTKVEMDAGAAPPAVRVEPKRFIVDRPFLVVIRDETTGATLFVGQIVDPK
jgi:serpin B